jgi:hypothetical protein
MTPGLTWAVVRQIRPIRVREGDLIVSPLTDDNPRVVRAGLDSTAVRSL